MQIAAPCVVSLVWRLDDAQDQLIDELPAPVEFFYGGGDLLPAIEQALAGAEAGYTTRLQLEPEQAFGDYDPKLVFYESRSLFPDGVERGLQFEGVPPGAVTEGLPPDALYTVTELYPEHVVLDGNHPLAGIALRLDVTVKDVRPATDEEVEAGTVGTPALSVLGGNTSAGQPLH